MWRPVAVFTHIANPCERLALSNVLTPLKLLQGFDGQMSIQREKLVTNICSVLQHHQWPIIEWRGVFCEQVDLAIERCMHRSSWTHEQINPQVNGPAFGGRIIVDSKLRSGVDTAGLIVLADAKCSTGGLNLLKYFLAERRSLTGFGIGSEKSAPGAQIKSDAFGGAEVGCKQGSGSAGFIF